jgi:hypothetical protein
MDLSEAIDRVARGGSDDHDDEKDDGDRAARPPDARAGTARELSAMSCSPAAKAT